MNKIKKIISDNKYTMFGLLIFIALVVLGFGLYKFLFPNIGSPVYGNRLDGIEEVKITKNQSNEIIKKLEEQEIVIESKTDIEGKILNVIITVKEDTKLDDAKNLTTTIVEELDEKQLAYYDIQVFLKNEKENVDGYPTIGYLGKKQEKFYYSSATVKEETEE